MTEQFDTFYEIRIITDSNEFNETADTRAEAINLSQQYILSLHSDTHIHELTITGHDIFETEDEQFDETSNEYYSEPEIEETDLTLEEALLILDLETDTDISLDDL
jgi:hypothetical protein